MLDILFGTIIMRPYVFIFFMVFLLICIPHIGWRKTFTFTGAAY